MLAIHKMNTELNVMRLASTRSLCEHSTCPKVRIAASLVPKDGEVVHGWLEPLNPADCPDCLELPSDVMRCSPLRAGEAAIAAAIDRGIDLDGARLYLAGEFPDGRLWQPANYTTEAEEQHLANLRIAEVVTPAHEGYTVTLLGCFASDMHYAFLNGPRPTYEGCEYMLELTYEDVDALLRPEGEFRSLRQGVS